ncbi:MAG: hypothetical protein HY673_10910 [Chloroflexi bacterium]|nr:hypothetical protein [Chloroflexota bacterium]
MKKHLFLLLSLGLVGAVLASCAPQPAIPAPTTAPPAAPTQATPKPKAEATRAPAPATPAPQPTRAPAEAPYYQGKTIEILVESSAGGGTDTIARISAPYLTKHIPGNPKVIIRNQPGGAGAIANNVFTEKAKPDGLQLLQNSSSPISMQLRSRDLIKYDLTKYRTIGNVSRGESILMIRKGLKDRLTDSSGKGLVVGTKEGEETWQAIPLWAREFLGWNVRWVPGFGGTSEMELAFRRGELDLFGTANAFIIRRLAQEGLTENITTIGSMKGDKFLRRPDFPDVPTFDEMLGSKKPTGVAWQAYIVWVGPNLVDKFLVAPPGTPDRIVNILTDAYAKMAKDPQFDEIVKKTVSDVYEVGIGKDVELMLKQIVEAPPEALNYSRQLQQKFGILAK